MGAPYYQADGVTLYHGDCREATAWTAADVLVTDPPYGIQWANRGASRSGGRRAVARKHRGIANDGDTSVRDGVLVAWSPRPAVVFGSFYAPSPADVRHICVWEKPGDAGVLGSTSGYRRDVEAVFLCGNWPHRAPAWGSVLRSATGGASTAARIAGHPHAKPVDLLCTLIDRAPAGVIADPFAGSGSTLIAARMCGRRAVGVELDERHCETIARRLSQRVLFADGAA